MVSSTSWDERYEEYISVLIITYMFVVTIGLYIDWKESRFTGKLLIDAVATIATLIMVAVIAFQTKATNDMAEKTSEQARLTYEMVKQMVKETALMNETLIEMKKQRLKIEEYKNALITYLIYMANVVRANADRDPSTPLEEIKDPHSFFRQKGDNYFSDVGRAWALWGVIQRFLKRYGIDWKEIEVYNLEVERLNNQLERKGETFVRKIDKKFLEKSKHLNNRILNVIRVILYTKK